MRRCIGNLGDVDWLNHGGRFVFQDGGRVEIEVLQEPCGITGQWDMYTIEATKMRLATNGTVGPDGRILMRLVDRAGYAPFWDPVPVAMACGIPLQALVDGLTSDDPLARAEAYLAVWSVWGIHVADTPIGLTRKQVIARYGHLRAAGRRRRAA